MSATVQSIRAALEYAAANRPQRGGFPYLAEALRRAGVTGYFFDVASASTVYTTSGGAVLQVGAPIRQGMVELPPFDKGALVRALRADQAGESSFSEFVERALNAGVYRFEVDTAARTCTYFGPDDQRYVESYPAVGLPTEPNADTETYG